MAIKLRHDFSSSQLEAEGLMKASVVIHPGVNFGIFEVLERNPYQSCVLGAAKADFDVFYQKTTAIFSVKTELWNLYMKSHTSPSLPLRRLMREGPETRRQPA